MKRIDHQILKAVADPLLHSTLPRYGARVPRVPIRRIVWQGTGFNNQPEGCVCDLFNSPRHSTTLDRSNNR
jgi:hypothetical protein